MDPGVVAVAEKSKGGKLWSSVEFWDMSELSAPVKSNEKELDWGCEVESVRAPVPCWSGIGSKVSDNDNEPSEGCEACCC